VLLVTATLIQVSLGQNVSLTKSVNMPLSAEVHVAAKETHFNARMSMMNDHVNKTMRPQMEIREEDKLNIILLYANDWRYDTLSAAGNTIVLMPNRDRLTD
jgi:hypothetical protein